MTELLLGLAAAFGGAMARELLLAFDRHRRQVGAKRTRAEDLSDD